jgi:hypothetical protein
MAEDSKSREGAQVLFGAAQEALGAPTSSDTGAVSSRSGARTPTIYVTDAAAESARIADTLRRTGYLVVDVPLSMLVSRAQAQRPNVVLVDIDAANALDEVHRLRRVPGGGAIDFVYFGSGGGPIRSTEDAMSNEGSAFFPRPVDIPALVRRLEALTGGPIPHDVRPSTPPPLLPSSRGSAPPALSSSPSLPGPGLRAPGPPLPMSTPSLADLVDPPRSLATFGTVSSELQQLLAEAEMRAEGMAQPELPIPSPEEEIEAVLPADVLASLDEPIEGDEDDDHDMRMGTAPGDREGTGAHAKGTTAGGRYTTASGRSTATPHTHERRIASDIPPARERTSKEPAAVRRSNDLPASGAAASAVTRTERLSSLPAPSVDPGPRIALDGARRADHAAASGSEDLRPSQSPARGPSEGPARAPALGVVISGPIDARRFLADAISKRLSGALCFEHDRVIRRIVVREGDLVTAASGAEQESLVCFLGARGELPRDEVERLAGKVPPYGRHAGAALIAHGWLGQDQLWSVLRAHAEWIATSVLRLGGGTAQLEAEPPGRLRTEPSVFGASTGAEIFIELVRRAVSPHEAIEALGGEGSRIGDGPMQALLPECALPPAELELVTRSRAGTLGELLARSPEAEIATVVHGLALLGVLDVVPAADAARAPDRSGAQLEANALDEEAIRARIRARLELVDEGDYFSVLGVSRDATSYEVRRAFVELRRAFEPSRILSPRLADLADDVRKIVVVLEEAYEILRDGARRERYKKAIEARPG